MIPRTSPEWIALHYTIGRLSYKMEDAVSIENRDNLRASDLDRFPSG